MATRVNYTFPELFDLAKYKLNEYLPNKLTYWGKGSKISAIFKPIVYMTEFIQFQINIATLSFRVATARKRHLDNRLEDWQLFRNLQTFAAVNVTFTRKESVTGDVVILAGTQISTESDAFGNKKVYVSQDDTIMTSDKDTVKVYCLCTKVGSAGNTAANTITQIISTLSSIDSITNEEDVTNGYDGESDDELRKRLPDHILGLQKGNKFAIYKAAYSIPGITVVSINDNYPAVGNFVVFISNETGTIDDITFEDVYDAIDDAKGLCETFTLQKPQITESTIEFDLDIDNTNYDSDTLIFSVKDNLRQFINKIRRNEVFLKDIISFVSAINGVNNIKNVYINDVNDDLVLSPSHVAKIMSNDDITINLI